MNMLKKWIQGRKNLLRSSKNENFWKFRSHPPSSDDHDLSIHQSKCQGRKRERLSPVSFRTWKTFAKQITSSNKTRHFNKGYESNVKASVLCLQSDEHTTLIIKLNQQLTFNWIFSLFSQNLKYYYNSLSEILIPFSFGTRQVKNMSRV